MKKAKSVLDALAQSITNVSHALTGQWRKRSRLAVLPR